jgi:hypothetical protein
MQNFARLCAVAAALFIIAAALPLGGVAQQNQSGGPPAMDHMMPGHTEMPGMMQHRHHMMTMHDSETPPVEPTQAGQDAFGAIQEIVQILEADPKTDWSRVNLEALRQHLIDMNEVTLNAKALPKPVDGGLEIAVTGTGRTIEAIQRMVPAHARFIAHNHPNGWSAKAPTLPDGVLLTVTSSDPKEVQHIRGLGFIGIMVSGHHHRRHHLAMARGEMMAH